MRRLYGFIYALVKLFSAKSAENIAANLRICAAVATIAGMDYLRRQRQLRDELADRGLDALLVTHLPNVRYLCGFTGSAGILLIGPGARKPIFVTDGRYSEQANEQVQGAKIVISKGPALEAISQQVAKLGIAKIGIE